jgi:acyl-CoA thioesterase-1
MNYTYLFIGDSITEAGRFEDRADPLGDGYVHFISDELAVTGEPVQVVNRGVSGNRVGDLRARWQEDCLDLKPALVSIAVGINDTWRRYDSGDATTASEFERVYRQLLEPLHELRVEIVLVEPFLIPLSTEQQAWREDLDAKIGVVRRLAEELRGTLIRADDRLNEIADEFGRSLLTTDGVHLTPRGHRRLAKEWLREWRSQTGRVPSQGEDKPVDTAGVEVSANG